MSNVSRIEEGFGHIRWTECPEPGVVHKEGGYCGHCEIAGRNQKCEFARTSDAGRIEEEIGHHCWSEYYGTRVVREGGVYCGC